MRKILLTFLMIIIVILVNTNFSVQVKAAASKSAMQEYVEKMQPGWNLGNTFEAPNETAWGNPSTTKELIDALVAQGYKSIRIPITWQPHMGDAPSYTIEPDFMNRIQEVVDWSLDAGLYVIINLHHDTGWIINMETQHDEVLNRFQAVWKQIANHFKSYPNKLSFESVNEPRFSDDWSKDTPKYFEMLDELNTSFHTIVRQSGGNNEKRPLVLPTITSNHSQARLDELYKTIAKLKDNYIIATIHYYGFYPFSVNLAGATTFNDEARNDLIQAFDRAYVTFVSKGIPVLVGEYGLLGFDKSLETIQRGEALKFFEYITYYAKQKGLTLMLWDNGRHFNRNSLEWGDIELYNIMKASLNSRSSNAQTDSIFIKKDSVIQDVPIQMNLNGNSLVKIKHGDTVLVNGRDYDLNGDQLTIKAALLEALVTKKYGVNAILTCEFSEGANWNFNIIYYDTPKLASMEGLDSMYAIPTAFNGDRLATMEAVYSTGGNAGPQGWTPFKEYGFAYSPSYEGNEIKLTEDFFKETKDGEVQLSMHFWSGELITYTLTKNQSTINGVSSQESKEAAAVLDDADTLLGEDKGAVKSADEAGVKGTQASTLPASSDKKPFKSSGYLLYSLLSGGMVILLGIGIYVRITRRTK